MNYGVYAENASGTGFGVYALASSPTGAGTGGRFESLSAVGVGVYGKGATGGQFDGTGTNGAAVSGFASGGGYTFGGMFGSTSPDGIGVRGTSQSLTGTAVGGSFSSWSQNGTGVFGEALATSGVTYGVRGQSMSPDGWGVIGKATATTGGAVGVQGEASSSSGIGVHGTNAAATGASVGVRGSVGSIAGSAVLATNAAGGSEARLAFGSTGVSAKSGPQMWAIGGYFSTDAPSGHALRADASALSGPGVAGSFLSMGVAGTGVEGRAGAPTGNSYGVRGLADSPAGYGVYSAGRFGASGTKAFRIDHPEDPENRYLLHYSSESPEVINFYRGTVTLDGSGTAVVELPAYFARVNTSPSYQVTAFGAPMPLLHVAEGIGEADLVAGAAVDPGEPAPVCRFRIAGGVPGGRVCWRVEAVRHDLFVRTHGAPVEMDKPEGERGYQHPALYGQSERVGPHAVRARE